MVADLEATVRRLREHGGDTANIEVKAAGGGLPESITSSLCALANLPGGGLVILGLDERLDFAPVALGDIQALKQGLVGKARACEPPVELVFVDASESVVEGSPVVAAYVVECDPSAKPVRVAATRRGYVRGWDGDFMMSPLEEQAFLGLRRQPNFDRQPVPGAGRDDLDPNLVALWSTTARELDSHGLGRFEGEELLVRAGVISGEAGTPTVAGLLALGRHPQQFLPRFVVNLSAEPVITARSARARNLTTASGPIPVMLEAALDWARRTFDRSVVSTDDGSVRDRYQYPLEAFRELIGNALVHRDLAPWSQGDAVEVRLLSDRLVITNPGGLYGITVDRLGREGTTSARNARLLEILKYTRAADGARVVETLASGIPRVLAAVEADHLPPPEFQNADIRFTVLLRESSEAGRAWPAAVRLHGSERAIAGALSVAAKTVVELESELGMKGPNIRRVLRALVEKGVVVQEGGKGRTTTYRLRDDPRPSAR